MIRAFHRRRKDLVVVVHDVVGLVEHYARERIDAHAPPVLGIHFIDFQIPGETDQILRHGLINELARNRISRDLSLVGIETQATGGR